MAHKYNLYRKVVNYFKKHFPTKYSIKVIRVPYKTLDGMCIKRYNPSRIVIRINRELDVYHAIDTFLHEYAHALLFDKTEEGGKHDAEWGKIYAKIYRAYEKEFCIKDAETK